MTSDIFLIAQIRNDISLWCNARPTAENLKKLEELEKKLHEVEDRREIKQ